MTEIPEHLRKRAEEARRRAELATEMNQPTQMVEVPVALLEQLKDWLDLSRSTDYYRSIPRIVNDLIALIPEPAYEPDILLIQEYAWVQGYSNEAARQELIDLRNRGLTVSITNQSER